MKQLKGLFGGSIVALVTPMTKGQRIDFNKLKELVEWHGEMGTSALVVMGTTGESVLVDEVELIDTVSAAIEFAENRIPIIAGCGLPSTHKTVELAKKLARYKPAAMLSVVPYYVKATQEGLYQHFLALAESTDVPVILYNVPSRTAGDLGDETLLKLAKHKNIIGIKDATADIARLRNLYEQLDKDFIFLSGDDETAFEFIKNGGKGIISVTANIAPKEMAEWTSQLLDGNSETAQSINESLKPLHKAMFIESNPIPIKWALSEMKKIEPEIRLPLTSPSTQSKQIILNAMRAFGLFNIGA